MGGKKFPKKYDDASWHSEGDFPDDLPEEAGATHIAMFVAWAAIEGLASEDFLDDNDDEIDALRKRKATPGEFLLRATDGRFDENDLNLEGRAFTQAHYVADDGLYLQDYETLLCADLPSLYHAADSWENYDRLAPVLRKRLAAWRKTRKTAKASPKKKKRR